jgi:2-polyprenyl-6-methoxyphenol hydroxylase-like FAD-dependent oxidoreductase
MRNREVLISGAGIAGPALAYWLSEHGFTTTVVERAPAPRTGGQTVDLRGAGRTVVERMGLMDRVRGLSLDQRGIAFVGADGHVAARMPTELFGGEGIVSDVEVLRGDLGQVLYQATVPATEYLSTTRSAGLTKTMKASRSPSRQPAHGGSASWWGLTG